MPDHAPQGPMRRPGLLGWIALLPGVLAGFCLGAWMLAIALEWLGDAFFWRNTCASHSEQVLQATWQWWRGSAGALVWLVEDLAIVRGTLQQGIAALIASFSGQSGLFWTEAVTTVIHCAILSAGNVTLTFLLRLAILLQALPLFALIIVVGLIDGLVRRDLRRFGAGMPIFLVPESVFIPAAAGIGLAVSMTGGSFKKFV
ncbi:DUF4400 domain-containing protein [Salmonella bongori]|nr:DUF4400 domain-containing protein [Salmonella bongori]EIT4619244.1 DUF4400 domain-containing protein [Salmonella bongori]